MRRLSEKSAQDIQGSCSNYAYAYGKAEVIIYAFFVDYLGQILNQLTE